MEVTLAHRTEERQEAQALFEATVKDIAPTAVPAPEHDGMFRTLLAQVRDEDGRLVAAAMSCEPMLTASLGMLAPEMLPAGLKKAVGQTSELDLIAVLPEHRCKGLGSRMIEFLEPLLIERGVRTWFGHSTDYLDIEALRRFYARHGFNIVPAGELLPPFHGQKWEAPLAKNAPLSFWKRLPAST